MRLARYLGLDAVVIGTIRRTGSGFELNVEVLNVMTDVDALIGAAVCRFLQDDREGAKKHAQRALRQDADCLNPDSLKKQLAWIPKSLEAAQKMAADLKLKVQ